MNKNTPRDALSRVIDCFSKIDKKMRSPWEFKLTELEQQFHALYILDHELTEGGFVGALLCPSIDSTIFTVVRPLLKAMEASDVLEILDRFNALYGDVPEDYLLRVRPMEEEEYDDVPPPNADKIEEQRLKLIDDLEDLRKEYYQNISQRNAFIVRMCTYLESKGMLA